MKTGDSAIVDEWLMAWPEESRKAIQNYIPQYQHVVKFRTSVKNPTIKRPLGDSFQLVINYNSDKECFIVWNAAIQNHIHHGNKIRPSLGKEAEERLLHPIQPDDIISFYRETGRGGSDIVELVLIIGKKALSDFCKQYKELIKPNPRLIPKGKACIFAVAGGEMEYIQRIEEYGDESNG